MWTSPPSPVLNLGGEAAKHDDVSQLPASIWHGNSVAKAPVTGTLAMAAYNSQRVWIQDTGKSTGNGPKAPQISCFPVEFMKPNPL